jgi:hypothetical protein
MRPKPTLEMRQSYPGRDSGLAVVERDGMKSRRRRVGNGMNNATRTARTADRMGPNIGTSSNRPASTPSTTA